MHSSTPTKDSEDIITTIDSMFNHHYFHQRLQQLLVDHKKVEPQLLSINQLTDTYYQSQSMVIEEISSTMDNIITQRVRTILNSQFIDLNQQISAMKQQIYNFTEQQHKLTQNLKKQVFRIGDELRRKSLVSNIGSNNQITSSSTNQPVTGSGIRFSRNSYKTLAQGDSDKKSYHSEILNMRKQLQQLKSSLQNSESIKILRDQFNEYKLQSKISIQCLNQKQKKTGIQSSLAKSAVDKLVPNLKQVVEQSVKRSLKSMLAVYGTYAEQISAIKQDVQKLGDSISKGDEMSMEYFSAQLKSVWMIINDLKRNVDSIVERNNLDMSMEIL